MIECILGLLIILATFILLMGFLYIPRFSHILERLDDWLDQQEKT